MRETVQDGILCGYPVVDLKAVVYDGSHHPVDSSEFAFKIAASMALKAAFGKAKPLLLEPYHTLSVQTPEQYTGEIVGEISGKRGKIIGMDADSRFQTIKAHIPHSSLRDFHMQLVRLTQGRARYTYSFSHYEEVPQDITSQIVTAKETEDNA